MSVSLPTVPWDRLEPLRARAAAVPGGLVDLSIGTPVDPTPRLVRDALAAASDAPGYPTVHGTAALRSAVVGWLARRHGVRGLDPEAVLPVIGAKEFVAAVPAQLGIGAGDVVAHPALAYPTYDIGARLAHATPVAADGLLELGPQRVKLLWVNSPGNPHGRVLPVAHLRKVVAWCRERDVVLASDECYLEFGWDEQPYSILHPAVCDGDVRGLLSVHSLSKRSNLAGYRAGFVVGDPELIAGLVRVRRHAGAIVPAPVQAAMTAALGDDEHVDAQRGRYARRREVLRTAVEAAGLRVDHSDAGLYLWVTRGEPCWETAAWFADRGVLVALGDFYGAAGAKHVRVALTATDADIDLVAARLTD